MSRFILCLGVLGGCAVESELSGLPPDDPLVVSPSDPAGAPPSSGPAWLTPALEVLASELPPEVDVAGQDGVVGAPAWSSDGRRIAAARRVDGNPWTELVAVEWQGRWVERVLVAEGMPDRPALSADGRFVAFVASTDGLPALFVVPFEGGKPAQLTNRDLRREKREGAPTGFVPPPHDDSLAFDGDTLVWDTPDGPQSVVWR